jgi:uncharacterized protein YcbK (DUF882 family)
MISEHFQRSEFECRCGCGFDTVDVDLIKYLEKIRVHFNDSVSVSSGCRCQEYNRGISGAIKSQHILGRAADIVVTGVGPAHVADYAESVGVPGVGRYGSFTHIDSRGNIARWVSHV